jgi:ribosome-binding protein aMBF1 (putative translation factor)
MRGKPRPTRDVVVSGPVGRPGRPVEGPKLVRRFARNLKRARRAAGLTQTALAGRAKLARPYIVQLEAATREPSIVTVVTLAKALQIKPGSLLQ